MGRDEFELELLERLAAPIASGVAKEVPFSETFLVEATDAFPFDLTGRLEWELMPHGEVLLPEAASSVTMAEKWREALVSFGEMARLSDQSRLTVFFEQQIEVLLDIEFGCLRSSVGLVFEYPTPIYVFTQRFTHALTKTFVGDTYFGAADPGLAARRNRRRLRR